MKTLTILKLGGSIITHKNLDGRFNAPVVRRLGKEIKKARPYPLILIHGAGGRTHRLAKQFKLQGGAKSHSQIIGSLATHLAAAQVTQDLSQTLLKEGLPVLPLQTSAVFAAVSGRAKLISPPLIQQALNAGLIPMLSGDMVLDRQTNLSILSGDSIAITLADTFNAKRIVFATDVDGLFNKDPKTYRNARLIEKLTPKQLKEMLLVVPKTERDATGEMLGKIAKISTPKRPVPISIINGLRSGRLEKALCGRGVIGTHIK
ncbi:hypothetical protein A2V68_02090 [candidate division Kazan bacterium RBG_13_50_9]|uniref:Isopentenyl phosphate kinase n=1 Tax=candidate division Kazan bacterium RBG_13_50_9 TaxID=1798535 RepID=A0A1F4NT82_UNCK3|nr:MAG: hypothetical protein A2V68_02090 [candidate division Kazan bacterium RBG_13_50_9]